MGFIVKANKHCIKFITMTAIEFQYNLINLNESLLRFAFSLTADRDDARDLVQETFMKALKYYDKFVHDSNFKAWIFAIMRNTFINNYRRNKCYGSYSKVSCKGLFMNYPNASGVDNPDSVYTTKELEQIVEALDDNFKMPFKMHHEGFKYKEIAKKLDLNLGTVKSRIFFARKKLMRQLTEFAE
jgi:RNA polymerase sigma-70 factor, ECF subfamily